MSASARFGEGAKFDAGEMVASVAGTECGSRPAAHCFDSVVIVSPYFWNFGGEMWQTTHHVAQEFARIVPTVVIEPSPTWNVWSEQFNARRLLQSIVGAPAFSPEPNVAVFRRRGLPLGRLRSVRERALAGNARRFTRALKERGFQRTLLWHSFPYWSESLVDSIDHSLLAYHCLDHCTRDEERRLIGKADVVFSVSETLVERHGRVNGQSYLLPNGVDLTLFDREGAARQRRPEELPTGGRLIGFVGSINCHLDIELLLTVAHSFPRDFLVLVGNVLSNETAPRGAQAEAFKRLKSLRNVRCLGFRPPHAVPAYVHAFDVCLIPFLNAPFNRDRDPLKFYEYVALGKPVVATPVTKAEPRYRDVGYMVDSADEFVRATAAALEEGDSEDRAEARIAVARAHGWQSVVSHACRVLRNAKANAAVRPVDRMHSSPHRTLAATEGRDW